MLSSTAATPQRGLLSMIAIDGAMGEGGGQVLRTALSLSLLTGQAFHLRRIRANRDRPGLRPQHLAAVQAASQISHAIVDGDRIGSQALRFVPGPVEPGDVFFDIGTAGATSLVLQTLLLPLALAPRPSRLILRGGTHVPWSPCFHYLDWHWRLVLARLGVPFELSLHMAGFYPQGGGEIQANIPGSARLSPLDMTERGRLLAIRGLSAVANLPWEIAEPQRDQALRRLQGVLPMRGLEQRPTLQLEALPASTRGTLLLLLATFERGQACCCAPPASARSGWPMRPWRPWRPVLSGTGQSIHGSPINCCCPWPSPRDRRCCARVR